VRLTLAGHPQPMLRRPDGTVLPVGCCEPPMGILPEATWSETLLELGPGDTLVLYTDGVTEARNACGQQFGEDAFAELLAATAGSSAEVTAEAVLAAVDRQLAGSSRPADDLAVLVLRV
jgi:serine phosphatase RsbU (regulator of sigma subunit)